MAETSKTSSGRPPKKQSPVKAAPVKALSETSVPKKTAPVVSKTVPTALPVPSAPAIIVAKEPEIVVEMVKSTAKAVPQAIRQASRKAEASRDTLRLAMTEAATASTRGVLEVNDKVIEAFRVQSDAALDLWRSTLSAATLADAIHVQTTGVRQVCETAAAQWKDIAETTTRWIDKSVQPIQSVWSGRAN